MMHSETINGAKIFDWESFHKEFQQKMGFFDGYGNNGNAWLDCMRDMYTNGEYQSLTKFNLNNGEAFVLRVINTEAWKENDPETFNAFLEMCQICNKEVTHFYLELKGNT
jgi:lysyl-tRNA synthetase class I